MGWRDRAPPLFTGLMGAALLGRSVQRLHERHDLTHRPGVIRHVSGHCRRVRVRVLERLVRPREVVVHEVEGIHRHQQPSALCRAGGFCWA